MGRLSAIGLVFASMLAFATPATAATATSRPVVPRPVQLQILHRAPGLAYVPTRMAPGFRYVSWRRTPATVRVTFAHKTGRQLRFVAVPLIGSCRAGMERSFQLAGNRVYWSHTRAEWHWGYPGAEQQAWRCVANPSGRQIRLVASSPEPPTRFAGVGLGRIVASGKRIAA